MTDHSGHRKRKMAGEAGYEKISVQRNGKSIHLGENKFKKEDFARRISLPVCKKSPSASMARNFIQSGIFIWDDQSGSILEVGVGACGEAAEEGCVCIFYIFNCACDMDSVSGNILPCAFRDPALPDEEYQHLCLALAVWRRRRKKR